MSAPILNLLKLSVGTESVDDLRSFHRFRLKGGRGLFHITRMVPKRADELTAGGSIYWVIKGNVQARQAITAIEPFTDGQGIRRCRIMLGHDLVDTQWQPRRPFQGWRYLKPEDAPADLARGEAAMPAELRAQLSELGLA
ncbi:DUF1489 domain-containing protein [Rhizobiaceae bacterium]|nr:DUF1489 domain-containing protein [Rhizobiaceae bacterium]